jgi:hypothetical protein
MSLEHTTDPSSEKEEINSCSWCLYHEKLAPGESKISVVSREPRSSAAFLGKFMLATNS